ncbi:MAG: hydrogenase maturation nickel metallochaperone HypA [Lachnospiraceae bacterium]|nr:hydrogenase maturation nickel metallochaperone HypA [Lachnospiraceae bacterium]
MSFVISIIDTVLKTAEEKNIQNITCVKVSVGAMTGALPEYLEKYFREASKGTLLEHAVLETKIIPVAAECSDCGSIYTPERSNRYLCPGCGSSSGRVIQGRDIVVDSVICN